VESLQLGAAETRKRYSSLKQRRRRAQPGACALLSRVAPAASIAAAGTHMSFHE